MENPGILKRVEQKVHVVRHYLLRGILLEVIANRISTRARIGMFLLNQYGLKIFEYGKESEKVLQTKFIDFPVKLRLGTSDIWTLFEVFSGIGIYNLPKDFIDKLDKDSNVTIYDIGANVGLTSIKLTEQLVNLGLKGKIKVVAVEAYEPNFNILEFNLNKLAENKGSIFEIVRKAITGKVGKVKIGRLPQSKAYHSANVNGIDGYDIESIPMSSLFKYYPPDGIILLKIDIEGSEQLLFQDSDLSWLDKVSLLFIEEHTRIKGLEDSFKEIPEILRKHGFELISNPKSDDTIWVKR